MVSLLLAGCFAEGKPAETAAVVYWSIMFTGLEFQGSSPEALVLELQLQCSVL